MEVVVIVCMQREDAQTLSYPVSVKKPRETCTSFIPTHSPDCRPPTYRWGDLAVLATTKMRNYHLNPRKVHGKRERREKD